VEELEQLSKELLQIVYDIIKARLDGFLLAALKAKLAKSQESPHFDNS